MMLKEKSSPWARLKYLYVLPLAAVTVTVFARPEVSEKANEISAVKVNDLTAIIETKLAESIIAVDSVKPAAKKQTTIPEPSPSPRKVYDMAEKMPEYPGGPKALREYVSTNLKYPEAAKKAKTQGRVILQFVVEADGSIEAVQVIRSADKELDAEAVRVVKGMPKWTPGMEKGKVVAVKYTLPIEFRIPGEKTSPAASVSIQSSGVTGKVADIRLNGDNTPLIVVDGKVMENGLSTLAPDRIKSISVLKDASSTEPYGEKGKNGVIFVETWTDAEIAAGLNKAKSQDYKSSSMVIAANKFGGFNSDKTVYYIDGKQASLEEVEALWKDTTKGVSQIILKNEEDGSSKTYITTRKAISGDEVKTSGVVADKAGKPIAGASVLIEGTSKGTITDSNGVFTMTTPKDATLKVSFINKAVAKVKSNNGSVYVTLEDE